MSAKRPTSPMYFKTVSVPEVPHGRNGKHKLIVTRILSDLDQIDRGMAIKIPLTELGDSKEKIRSALNRATRKTRRGISTASDVQYLYIWNDESAM